MQIDVEERRANMPDIIARIICERKSVKTACVPLSARNGVREYWLIDPDARTIEVLKLEGIAYLLRAVFFEAGDDLTSLVLPELRLPVNAVFE